MYKKLLIIFVGLTLPFFLVQAHPGRTDISGCHTCRTNCAQWGLSTGEYHCHRSKGIPQSEEPIRSIRNESGTGVTVPALEYKTPVQKPSVQKIEPAVSPIQTIPSPMKAEKKSFIKKFFNWVF